MDNDKTSKNTNLSGHKNARALQLLSTWCDFNGVAVKKLDSSQVGELVGHIRGIKSDVDAFGDIRSPLVVNNIRNHHNIK